MKHKIVTMMAVPIPFYIITIYAVERIFYTPENISNTNLVRSWVLVCLQTQTESRPVYLRAGRKPPRLPATLKLHLHADLADLPVPNATVVKGSYAMSLAKIFIDNGIWVRCIMSTCSGEVSIFIFTVMKLLWLSPF